MRVGPGTFLRGILRLRNYPVSLGRSRVGGLALLELARSGCGEVQVDGRDDRINKQM